MKPNQFQCSMCKGVFDKEWSDEEAEAERKELFPDSPWSECDLICDDCFEKVKPSRNPEQYQRYLDEVERLKEKDS